MNKKQKRLAVLLLIAIALFVTFICSSCKGEAKTSVQDGDFKIDFLFEKDGCKVYRFNDGGTFVYWSNCFGNIQYNYTQTTGKTTHTSKIQSFTN